MEASYFINPAIDALATATAEERAALIRRIAACVGDEAALRAILGIDPQEFADFYPDMHAPELSTEDTIESFITLFAKKKGADPGEGPTSIEEPVSPAAEENIETEAVVPVVPNETAEPVEAVVPIVPVAPAYDYAQMLEAEGEDLPVAPDDSTSDMISSFLEAVPPKRPRRKPAAKPTDEVEKAETQTAPQPETPAAPKTETKGADEQPNLSEELFKLMVKNKNYTKALEIIEELSLNNPKKSVYFAYQMRFLKKLIKNQEKSAK